VLLFITDMGAGVMSSNAGTLECAGRMARAAALPALRMGRCCPRCLAWVTDLTLTRAFAPTIHAAWLLLLYLQEVLAQKAALEEGNKELQEKYNQKAM
jgi:hypothetical protein